VRDKEKSKPWKKASPLPKEVRPTTQKAMKLTKRLNYTSKKRMIVSFLSTNSLSLQATDNL